MPPNPKKTADLVTFTEEILNGTLHFLRIVKTKVGLKYFGNDCIWKQFYGSNLPQASLNLICMKILVALMCLTQF